MNHFNPESVALFLVPSQIRKRIALICWNLKNPVPSVAKDPSKLASVRKDANRSIRVYRAALRIHRKADARQAVRERYSNPHRTR